MIKIILDTNILISLLIGKEFRKYQTYIFDNEDIQIIANRELLSEFLDVVKKPKLQKYFDSTLVEEFTTKLINQSIFIEGLSKVNICRDFKDNFLLSLAKDGKADFLISSDMDLLVLDSFENTKITTLSNFISSHLI
jgi:putative PIN family toxin of toxin-antitoxin system